MELGRCLTVAILSTPAAVDHLNGRRKETGTLRPIGRRTLLRLANEGIVPVVWWEGDRPFFSDIALDEWQRRMERGAA